jgi:hypothetical protein
MSLLTGMTQQNLAEAIGTASRFKYESGEPHPAARLWEIAGALVCRSPSSTAAWTARGEGVDDPMDAKETFELVRAYYAIANGPRRELLGLIQALHAANEQGAAQPETVAAVLQE